jgi:YebC/PmpR family DNA-binding regulatory protein
MGRQWLHAKRAIVNLKKGQTVGKLVKEITVAAKLGGGDPAGNARLHAVLEKARRANVTREAIERAIAKGTGAGGDKSSLDHVVYEGYAPHKVPVIVEVYTDNHQRTAPEIRVLFKKGVLGAAHSNKFLFDHVGIVEATHEKQGQDLETVAIEVGAQNVEPLEHVPEDHVGARFVTDVPDLDTVTKALRQAGWSVTLSEVGYVAKDPVTLPAEQRTDVETFLAALDDNDDVHRIYTALK